MSIDRPANERLQLYERFKQSLRENNDADFFDADDLLIIIDQAVDLEDEYVQIEALMRGYRFFPDNEELANRRAFLYYDLNLDAGVRDMVDRKTDDSPMWDLLSLRLMEGNTDIADDARKVLEAIVARPEKFDDETIIQLVDCASACGLYDWLKANEKQLRKKTDYLPTLLYELFIVADMKEDANYCLQLLEELTEIEPFNVDFWSALAQTQCNADRLDDAMTSIDYALAIESDNAAVQTLRASILIRQEKFAEALRIIEPLLQTAPTAMLGELKVRALYGTENFDATLNTLEEFCRRYPDDRGLMEVALFLHHPQLSSILNAHYEASAPDDREKWPDWARTHYINGRLFEAAEILDCLRRNGALTYQGSKMLASALYCSDNFDAAADLLTLALQEDDTNLTPDVVVAGLMALLRQGKKRQAKQMFKKVMEQFPLSIKEDWTMASTLESIGFSSVMGLIHSLLEKSGPVNPEELDFFRFPANYDNANPNDSDNE